MKLRDRIKSLRRVPGKDLLPHPKNWRVHPEKQQNAMRGILAEVGIADCLIAYETKDGLQLIDGHLRTDVAPDTKWPVLVLDVNATEANKLLASHDPIAALAETDHEKLSSLVEELALESDALLDMLTDMEEPTAAKEVEQDDAPTIDQAAELQKKWKVKTGDRWLIKGAAEHVLFCGDCASTDDMGRLVGNAKMNLFFTSPPYNQNVGHFSKSGMHRKNQWVDNINSGSYPDNFPEDEYQANQVATIDSWQNYCTEDGSVFYNHKIRYRNKSAISPWDWLRKTKAIIRQEIIWYREGSVTQNMRAFMPVEERIYWMYFGNRFTWIESTQHKTWSTVWKVNSHKDRDVSVHGCAFPVELPARAIQACSTNGHRVCDPYCGSGTTLVAAEQLGRLGYAMEIEPSYCAVTLERMTNLGCKCTREKCQKTRRRKPSNGKPRRSKTSSNA